MSDKHDDKEAYYGEVLQTLEEHPDWVKEYSESAEEILNRAVNDGFSEPVYDHSKTSGKLNLQMPASGENTAIFGQLEQSLDPDLPHDPNSGYLSGKLVDAHHAIVSETESDRIGSSENTYDILFFDIPLDYEIEAVSDVLDQVSQASKQVQHMHDDITAVLNDYQ